MSRWLVWLPLCLCMAAVFASAEAGCGQPISNPFDGQVALSNGTDTGPKGGSCGPPPQPGPYGLKYQCVELIRRYYAQAQGIDTSTWAGNAVAYYNTASEKGLTAYPNGGSESPAPGDVLVFQGSTYGHVAIVITVSDARVEIIEQNWSRNVGQTAIPMTVADGKFTIAHRGRYRVLGWLRKPAINVRATLDGQSWFSGIRGGNTINYSLTGPTGAVAGAGLVPFTANNPLPGDYTLTYQSAGPENSSLEALWPCGMLVRGLATCTASLARGQSLNFLLQFKSLPAPNQPPTAGFLMKSGTQSAREGQSLTLSVPAGGNATVSFDGSTPTYSNDPDGTVEHWLWTVDGSEVFSTPKFEYPFSAGTHTVTLRVGDNEPRYSSLISGTIVVTEATAGSGWRQYKYKGQRTNCAEVSGPGLQEPVLRSLASGMDGGLEAIADDGSLLFRGVSTSYYSREGTLKWQTPISGTGLAIGPLGTIYVQTPSSVSALSRDTGEIQWTYSTGFGDETTPLVVDSLGVVYLQSGCTNCFMGPSLLSAIAPNGTLQFQIQDTSSLRGYPPIVLNNDDSLIYRLTVYNLFGANRGLLQALSTSSGNVVDQFDGGPIPGAFAPWGTLYADGDSIAFSQNRRIAWDPSDPATRFIRTYDSSNQLVKTSLKTYDILSGSLQFHSDPRAVMDTNGVLYFFYEEYPTTYIAAYDTNVGIEGWKLPVSANVSGPLLGGNGCLYFVDAGTLKQLCSENSDNR